MPHHNIFIPQTIRIRQITIEDLPNGKTRIGIIGDVAYRHSDGKFITLGTDISYTVEELPQNMQASVKNLMKFSEDRIKEKVGLS